MVDKSKEAPAAGIGSEIRGFQRNTRQREVIQANLLAGSDFRTAGQIHADLRAAGDRIGLSTVYRSLQAMTEAGELDVIRNPDGEAAYRRCSMGHHHHLVCRSCGHTVEVLGPSFERWASRIAEENGFRDVQHDLEIFGLCSACAARGDGSTDS